MEGRVTGKKNVLATALTCAALLLSHSACAADASAATSTDSGAQASGGPQAGNALPATTGSDSAEEKAPDWRESTLTGDWGGARQRLFDAGVQADLMYTADYLYNTTGGWQRGGAYVGHADLKFRFDGKKLVGWEGGSAYLHLISNSGGRANLNNVGSLMGVDNFEAPANRSGVFKAWLQQSFLDDKASLRVGLYPIDTEFYVTDSSGVFLHPSFGMAAEVGNFGSLAGPAIYVTSSYGVRLRVDPDPAWYAMLAVTQGVPSDRIATAGPNVSWQNGVGSMTIGEVGFSPLKAGLISAGASGQPNKDDDFEPISKMALGVWRYAPRFAQLDVHRDAEAAAHWGAYFLAEQTVYRVPESNRDLAAFFRYGLTDGRTSALGSSASLGLSFRGPLAGREKDTFGIAATRAHVGPQGRAQLADEVGAAPRATNETLLEVTYQAQLWPGIALQPLVQRIVHPGLYLPNATVAGVRLQLAL